MRIIGGKYKGRRIAVQKNFHSRPTTDFAKEGLFNILTNHFDFETMHFLDLFCGTGSIGIEAHSRGCPRVDLVDMNTRSVHHVNEVIKALDLTGVKAVHMEALKFIKVCHEQYQVVFADPPYDYRFVNEVPKRVLESNLLTKDGWFILEHSSKYKFTDYDQFMEERHFGNVHFSIFRIN